MSVTFLFLRSGIDGNVFFDSVRLWDGDRAGAVVSRLFASRGASLGSRGIDVGAPYGGVAQLNADVVLHRGGDHARKSPRLHQTRYRFRAPTRK